MFKSNNKNSIKRIVGKTLILMLILGGSIVLTAPKNAYAYVSKAEYTITETDYSGTTNTVGNPVPNIISINPNSGYLNSGEKTITITGNNFVRGSVARYDGSNRPTAFIDSTRLQMKLAPSDMAPLGAHKISVYNPLPGGGFSNAVSYNVINGSAGQVQGASTTKAVAKKTTSTPKKTASIVLAKGTDYKISCEDENNSAVFGTSTDGYNDGSNNEYYGNQSANVLSSDSNFLPDTLLEWILLFALIALVVVIWRKVTRTEAEKHAPLKHA